MKLKNIFLVLFLFNVFVISAQQIEREDIIGTFNRDSTFTDYRTEITFYNDSTFFCTKSNSFEQTRVIDIYLGSFTYDNNTIHLNPTIHKYNYYYTDTRHVSPDSIYQDKQFIINNTFIVTAYKNNLYLLPEYPSYLSIESFVFPFFINSVNAQKNWKISGLKKPINYYTSIENIPLPKEWKEKIHIIPLEAKIIKIQSGEKSKIKHYYHHSDDLHDIYTINKGTKDKVFKGMELWLNKNCWIEVLEVYDDYSLGFTYGKKGCRFKTGKKLSSKP